VEAVGEICSSCFGLNFSLYIQWSAEDWIRGNAVGTEDRLSISGFIFIFVSKLQDFMFL
jgi:hypothetical protein